MAHERIGFVSPPRVQTRSQCAGLTRLTGLGVRLSHEVALKPSLKLAVGGTCLKAKTSFMHACGSDGPTLRVQGALGPQAPLGSLSRGGYASIVM
jgi:hypothetical protein